MPSDRFKNDGVIGEAADAAGSIHAQLRAIEAAAASGGTVSDSIYVDDGVWTDDVSKHQLTGGIYQSVPQTVTDGRTAPIQVDANGNLIESNSAAALALLGTIDADTSNIPALGQAAMAASAPVAIASDQSAVPVTTTPTGARDVTNATGTGSGTLATTAIAAAFDLKSVTCHFSAALAAAETMRVWLDANDGAAYDTLLYSENIGTAGSTNFSWIPSTPIPCEAGDKIYVTLSANTGVKTYGLRIVADVR